jgi:hypothetical protein
MSVKDWDVGKREEVVEDPGLRGRLNFFRIIIVAALFLLLARVYWLQQTSSCKN